MSRPPQPLAFQPKEATVTVPLVLGEAAAEALLDFQRKGQHGSFELHFTAGRLRQWDKRQTGKVTQEK